YFPLHRDICDLPSFPTRRSSDLRPPTGSSISAPKAATPAAISSPPAPPKTSPCARRVIRGSTSAPTSPAVRRNAGGRDDGEHCSDRKSTRLNSSHRTISYAVFCL